MTDFLVKNLIKGVRNNQSSQCIYSEVIPSLIKSKKNLYEMLIAMRQFDPHLDVNAESAHTIKHLNNEFMKLSFLLRKDGG